MKNFFSFTLLFLMSSNIFFSQNISIAADNTILNEGSTLTLTASLDAVSTEKIFLPISTSGSATVDIDYAIDFPALGDETLIANFINSYEYFDILQDGRYVLLNNNDLLVYDSSTGSSENIVLSRNYENIQLKGNTIYTRYNQNSIYEIDITDLSSVIETEIATLPANNFMDKEFSIEGDNILYNTFDSENSIYKLYKKSGNDEPELIHTFSDTGYMWGLQPILLNDRVFMIQTYNNVYELVDDNFVLQPQMVNQNGEGLDLEQGKYNTHNGRFYAKAIVNGTGGYHVHEIDLETGIGSKLDYELSSEIVAIKDFSFLSNGNLVLSNYINANPEYGIYSYQLNLAIKIAAGDTTGTITFTATDDESDEDDETIIITPGTPTNGTLSDSSDIVATIEDNDDAAVVTFALSSETLAEDATSSITLTATATPVSGVDVTIPYTLSGTATNDEDYSVSDPEIVIPAGSESASITISAINDTDVEVIETIVFELGALTNGTTDTTDITLNLESEDDPEVSSIVAAPTSFVEGTSTTVTATISTAASRDLDIPLTLSGTAVSELDYTTTFASQGQETKVYDSGGENSNDNFGDFRVLSDGRYGFVNGNNLRIYDPETEDLEYISLDRGYNETQFSETENTFYGTNNQQIWKINILEDNSTVETSHLDYTGYNLEGGFSLHGDKLYYILESSGLRSGYIKDGANDPVLMFESNECCYSPILVGDRLINFRWERWSEVVNGNYQGENYLSTVDGEAVSINSISVYPSTSVVYNDDLYISLALTGQGQRIYKLDIDNNDLITVAYTPGDDIVSGNNFSHFDFDSMGNLLVYSQDNSNGNRSVYSYQFAPSIKIAAGDTTGTITFTATDDESDEDDETIIITPGTPTNGTLSDSSDIVATIEDNDDAAVVTFALSSETLAEDATSSITLTATATPVSGVDVTIPYTLSGTATNDEDYSVSDPEIVIPAGSESASITISAINDTDVEVIETIVFELGALTNGTTDTTDITLNLESEDEPISSLTATNPDMNEGESTSITLEIDEPTSRDVIVPLQLSGSATFNIDYTTAFETQGEETFLMNVNNNYNNMVVLSDGRVVFLDSSQVYVYDIATQTQQQYQLDNYANYINISGDTIYLKRNDRISKFNIDQFNFSDDGTNQIETILIAGSDLLGSNDSFQGNNIVAEGDTVLYQIYDWPNGYKIYKKQSDNDAELIYEGDQYAQNLLLFNGRTYSFNNSGVREIYNNSYTNYINYEDINFYQIIPYNNQVYALVEDNSENERQVVKLDIENDIVNSIGSQGSVELMPYVLGENHDFIYRFGFDNFDNLILLNRTFENDNYTYGLFSYQLFPEILISAGQTSGTFTFESIDDNSFEDDETIIVTPGEIQNASFTNQDPLTLSIIDDDNPPLITFELSSDSIVENSEFSVNLTATADVQSGVEITIPLIMSGTADLDEYELSSESIVIPPNATSANITISTFGFDDDEVEIAESIIFTFGEISNAVTETPSISLSLLSEDDPTINDVQVLQTELIEGESTEVTVTLSAPSSNDVYLPLVLGGSATNEIDYTTGFEAEGEETLIGQLTNNDFNTYGILEDGRHVFLNGNQIRVMSADATTESQANLDSYYSYMVIEGNTIYVANNDRIATVDITDISSSQAVVNQVVPLSNDQGFSVHSSFDVENGKIVYEVYVNSLGTRQIWLLESLEENPILLASSLNCCFRPVLVDGNVYRVDSWRYRQLFSDGEQSSDINYSGGGIDTNRDIVVKDGILYGFDSSQSGDVIVRLDLQAGDGTVSQAFDVDISEDINNTRSFGFSPDGNIVLVNGVIENNEVITQLNSYLQSIQIKINAGAISGSITVDTFDDDSYEFDETISIAYGTPANVNIGSIDVPNITILDNDTPPTVAFELSNETIVEGASESVTLTATLSEVSGYDVTVPFTMSGTAGADEYAVSSLSIFIPAGNESGAVEVSTTEFDDEEVEILETIIFNIAEITNGTSEITEAILKLESDDDPNLISVVAEPLEFAEHESSIITATIDQAASRDVIIPLSFSGTATNEIDYTTGFEAEGEESLIGQLTNSDFNKYGILEDGRHVFLNSNQIRVMSADATTESQADLGSSYYFMEIEGNNIYLSNNDRIAIADITDISSSQVTVEEIVSLDNLSGNGYSFHVENGKIVYGVSVNSSGTRQVWLLESLEEDPILLGSSLECCYRPVLINGNIYRLESWGYRQLIDGDDGIYISYNGGNINRDRKTIVKDNILYGFSNDGDIVKVDLEAGDGTVSQAFDIDISEDINNTRSFGFSPDGNIVLVNEVFENSQTTTQLNSYLQSTLIKISAGQLTGEILIQGVEDDLNAPGEESDETIEVSIISSQNASMGESNTIEDFTLTILNNEIDLVLDDLAFDEFFPALTNSSVAWGDFDRDGDQDMAVMGQSFFFGVITRVYKNDNGVFSEANVGAFAPTYEGDLMWVDYNKDGYIDLVVSGLDPNNDPSTIIYENINGQTFTPSLDLTLPDLFSTSMDSGDLDNDGDIDFVINGIDTNNAWKKFIYKRDGNQLILEEDYQGQFGGETGIPDGVFRIADNQLDGDLDIFILGETDSRVKTNTYIDENNEYYDVGMNSLEGASMSTFGNYVYFMGQDFDESMRFYRKSLINGDTQNISGIEGLKNGDIAIGDYNNDGFEDLVITGENSSASAVTKLYDGKPNNTFVENTEIELVGLLNSTAKWVDYDTDGDLDLFLNGSNDFGEFSLLYKTNLLNKTNSPSDLIENLSFENLGNGKVRLSWDEPNDDFSDNLGYVLRLGTTELGSELSNTESNLDTGQRLITKSTQINSNSFEISLDPGNYFWSVQSVDSGLKGSAFSEESTFQLTYEWKLLNQGGIIDRSISSVDDPIVKLTDIDGDNDMDLVYGSRASGSDIQIFRLGKSNFEYFDNVNDARGITDIEFLDINNDLVLDIIVNTWNSPQSNFLRLYNSNSQGGFNSVFSAPGLYQAKIELIDINNDGTQEIVHAGRTSDAANSQLKIFVFEQDGSSLSDQANDISNQLASGVRQGAFGFGDIDQDEDIDFGITGLSNFGARSEVFMNETIFTETVAPIYTLNQNIDFTPAYESTLDFVDFDADGDLDILLTGLGPAPLFKVFANNGLSGDDLDFIEVDNTGLLPIRSANLDYGDYNADGYLDILYTGTVSGIGEVTKLVEFDPVSNSYVESDFDLSDIVNASIAFGDIDGDDDLDFTVAGESISDNNSVIKTYLNVRNESADVISGSTGSRLVSSMSQNNNNFVVNERPTTPAGMTNEYLGVDPETGYNKVRFTWSPSSDDHTNQSGLSYALKVGTSEGGDDIMKVKALSNGYRLIAGRGNVEQNNEWQLNLPTGDYYWSVQAIDASFSGSYFSDTVSFNTTSLSTISQEENFLNITVYPNPVKDGLVYIKADLYDSLDVQLFDIQGRLVIDQQVNNNNIDVSDLSGGVYMLKIKSQNKSKTVKLIIQ